MPRAPHSPEPPTASPTGRRLLFGLAGLLLIATFAFLLLMKPTEDAPAPTPDIVVERPDPAPLRETPPGEPVTIQRVDPSAALVEELSRLSEQNHQALTRRLWYLLDGDRHERMAALRFLALGRVADPVPFLAQAIGDPDAEPAARSLALAQLEPRAQLDTRAQDGLCAFLALQPADPEERKLAFQTVLRWSRDQQLQSGLELIEQESDIDVAVAAAVSLRANDAPGAQSRRQALGWKHPDPEVRKRLRALGLTR